MSNDANYWGSGQTPSAPQPPSAAPWAPSPAPTRAEPATHQPAPWGDTQLAAPASSPWGAGTPTAPMSAPQPAPQPAPWGSPTPAAPVAQPSPWAAAGPSTSQGQWGATANVPQQGQWGSAASQPQPASPYGGYGAPGTHAQTAAKKSSTGVIIGILVAALVVAVAVIAYMLTLGRKPVDVPTQSPPTPVPTVTATNQTKIRNLTVGTCFDESATKDSVYTYAWPVDCTTAHDSEVFFTGTLPEGDYPSDDDVQTYVVDKCDPAFEQYVGIPYGDSKLQVNYIFADKSGWGAGNHSLVCYVVDPSGDRTSSVKGVAK